MNGFVEQKHPQWNKKASGIIDLSFYLFSSNLNFNLTLILTLAYICDIFPVTVDQPVAGCTLKKIMVYKMIQKAFL